MLLLGVTAVSACSGFNGLGLDDFVPAGPANNRSQKPVASSSGAPTKPSSKLAVVSGREQIESRQQQLLGLEDKPLTAASVGYYMDVQYANLQQKLDDSIAVCVRHGNDIHITFSGSSTFSTANTKLNPPVQRALEGIASVLREYDKTLVIVAGHTDKQGAAGYNQRLSEQRALAVGEYMAGYQVGSERVLIMGFGDRQPISSNETAEGRAQNRRVELILKPIIAEPMFQ